MGNKNKTISFRVNEDAFETLREIAEERDISLSAVFRDYVDTLVALDGLREQLDEHKRYVNYLREQLEDDGEDDVIQLEDLDGESERDEPSFRLG